MRVGCILPLALVIDCHPSEAFLAVLGDGHEYSRRFRTRAAATMAPDKEYSSIRDSWSLVVLGDLHLEDDMTAHHQARQDCLEAVEELSILTSAPADGAGSVTTARDLLLQLQDVAAKDLTVEQLELLLAYKKAEKQQQQDAPNGSSNLLLQSHLVSLGDLGRKDIRHEPGDAGTTKSFVDAKAFLDGFGIPNPYQLVTGNHDLEGLDEFDTDAANLQAFLQCFDKPTPHFLHYLGEKTVLLGLSTVRFRDAPYSSHEVHVDDDQLAWFVQTVAEHPADEGWKIVVVSHAPITGSGLRVLQNVHVTNGCAWLNHCSTADKRNLFFQTLCDNPQIKLWFSGHFHLSHDFDDSLVVPPPDQSHSCTFVQVGVMGPASTRDGKRQTRLVQGCRDCLHIYTINHHERTDNDRKATLRLDAEIHLESGKVTLTLEADGHREEEENDDDDDKTKWFWARTPRQEDGCYIENPDGSIADALDAASPDDQKVCWWHMKDGRVLGLHQGQLVEYDAETLSPLGIVVRDVGTDKQVVVVNNGTALVLVDDDADGGGNMQVVHPNEDGSYWRKVQRNKRVRQEEKARESLARSWFQKQQQQQQQ